MKCYIASRITGLNYDECFIKFEIAEKMIEQLGYEAVNPMKIIPREIEWNKAMRLCIKNLMDCEAICLLEDYKDSDGANLEFNIALKLDFKILMQNREAKKTGYVIFNN